MSRFHEVRVPLNTATLAMQNLEGEGVFKNIGPDMKEMVSGLVSRYVDFSCYWYLLLIGVHSLMMMQKVGFFSKSDQMKCLPRQIERS